MAEAEVSRLEIVVTSNTADAEAGLKRLCSRFAELQGRINQLTTKGLGQKLSSITKSLNMANGLNQTAKAADRATRSISKLAKSRSNFPSLEERLKEVDAIFAKARMERTRSIAAAHIGRKFSDFSREYGGRTFKLDRNQFYMEPPQQKNLPVVATGTQDPSASARVAMEAADAALKAGRSIKQAGDAARAAAIDMNALAGAEQSAAQAAQQLNSGFGGGGSSSQGVSALAHIRELADAASSHIAKMIGGLKATGSALLVLGRGAAGMALSGLKKGFSGLLSPVIKLKDAVAGLFSSLGGVLKRFGRIAVMRLFRQAAMAVFKAISEGVKNMYAYSSAVGSNFAPAMDAAATSLNYLKNSIGAAAAPIIQIFVPYLQIAINAVISFINILNQLFSALRGALTFTKAKEVTTKFDDSLKGAGGSAKKAKKEIDKFLASWDEITNIKTPDESSGGGGGGGGALANAADMFEEVPIDQAILDAINSGKWYELGQMLAEKLNSILPTKEQMYAWGQQLGGLINNGINFALGFMRTFNFRGLGERLSAWLNGGISAIEWDKLGALMVRRILALLDLVIGFIRELDTAQLAKALSDYLLGAWKEWIAWLKGTDWKEMGGIVAQKIVDFLTNIKWKELGETLWMLFNEGVKAAKDFFTGLDEVFKEKLGPIWELVKAVAIGFLLWKLADGLLGGLEAVKKLLSLINTATVGLGLSILGVYYLIDGIIDQVTNGLNWDNLGSQIGGIIILLGGLYLPLGSIGVAIGAIVTGIVEFGLGLREWIETGKASNEILTQMSVGLLLVGGGIALLTGGWIPLLITGIGVAALWIIGKWDAIKEKAGEVWDKIVEIWGAVGEWFMTNVVTPLGEKFDSLKAIIKLAFDAAWEWIKGTWATVSGWFIDTIITPLSEKFDSLKASIKVAFDAAWEWVKGTWSVVSEWFNTNVVQPVVEFFRPIGETIKGFFVDPIGSIREAWASLKHWFNITIITPIKEAFAGVGQTIKNAFFGALNTVIRGINSFTGMVNNIGIDWDGFQQTLALPFGNTLTWGIPGVHLKPFNLPTISEFEYAQGGFPNEGQMFIANEAGPELVGRIGSRTAVANNDQIVDALYQGVYAAMMAANSNQDDRVVKVYLDGRELANNSRKHNDQMARALGV